MFIRQCIPLVPCCETSLYQKIYRYNYAILKKINLKNYLWKKLNVRDILISLHFVQTTAEV